MCYNVVFDYVWAPAGGARVGGPPPLENEENFVSLYEPFCYVFLRMGGHFHHVGAFFLPFSLCGVPFFCPDGDLFLCLSPLYENFWGRPCVFVV